MTDTTVYKAFSFKYMLSVPHNNPGKDTYFKDD